MAQPLPNMNAVEAGELVDAMFENDHESEVTDMTELPYHVPVNINNYPNYRLADLIPNVVYYETERNPDGSYYLKEGHYDRPWRDHFLYMFSIAFLVITGSMLHGIL